MGRILLQALLTIRLETLTSSDERCLHVHSMSIEALSYALFRKLVALL